MTETSETCIHELLKFRLNCGSVALILIRNFRPPVLKIKIYKNIIYLLFAWVWDLVSLARREEYRLVYTMWCETLFVHCETLTSQHELRSCLSVTPREFIKCSMIRSLFHNALSASQVTYRERKPSRRADYKCLKLVPSVFMGVWIRNWYQIFHARQKVTSSRR
jgi:hypothetical protein